MKKSKLIQFIVDNNLENEVFTGSVLWFSERDGFGIILMENGSEIYTDVSVIKDRASLNKGQRVSFKFNTAIKDCACAKDVVPA